LTAPAPPALVHRATARRGPFSWDGASGRRFGAGRRWHRARVVGWSRGRRLGVAALFALALLFGLALLGQLALAFLVGVVGGCQVGCSCQARTRQDTARCPM